MEYGAPPAPPGGASRSAAQGRAVGPRWAPEGPGTGSGTGEDLAVSEGAGAGEGVLKARAKVGAARGKTGHPGGDTRRTRRSGGTNDQEVDVLEHPGGVGHPPGGQGEERLRLGELLGPGLRSGSPREQHHASPGRQGHVVSDARPRERESQRRTSGSALQ